MLDFDVRSPQGDAGKGVYKPLPDYLKKKKKKVDTSWFVPFSKYHDDRIQDLCLKMFKRTI